MSGWEEESRIQRERYLVGVFKGKSDAFFLALEKESRSHLG